MSFLYYYRPQTKLREDNVFTPVCHSVHWGLCPGWISVQGRSLSRGDTVQWGLCPGESLSGGGVSVRETPLYGKEWAVRILLECILVDLYLFQALLSIRLNINATCPLVGEIIVT